MARNLPQYFATLHDQAIRATLHSWATGILSSAVAVPAAADQTANELVQNPGSVVSACILTYYCADWTE